MKDRRIMHFFRPRKSVRAPEGMDPTMQPRENMAVIQPAATEGRGESALYSENERCAIARERKG